jgi:hypothetical protein
MSPKQLTLVSFLVAGAALVALAPEAAAQKKAKPVKACGISAIPLAVGNSWTYEPVAHPQALEENQTKLFPLQPKKVVITVAGVETKDGVTTIKLSEQADDRTIETTMTCTATSLTASPDSFFFAGEPGGSWNLAFDKMERKGHTFGISGGRLSGTEWHHDLAMSWKRTPTEGSNADLGAGKLTLERRMVIVADEPIATSSGNYNEATKVGIETHGEIAIDGADGKPFILPEGLVTYLWFVDSVGMVMVNNTFFHAYQLVSYTVAK